MHLLVSVSSLLVSILVVLAGAGVGRVISRFCRSDGHGIGEFLIDTAIGLGVLSLIVFVFLAAQVPGLTGSTGFTVLLTVIVLPFAVVSLLTMKREVIPAAGAACRGANWKSVIAGALLALLALVALVPALAPPSMSDWDSLAYHLSMPEMYLEKGGFHYIGFASHSNFPMLVEMLYVYPLSFGDPVAAKLIHYWMGVMLVGAVALVVRRHFNPNGAWLAAIAAAGMPILLWEATTAYIDLATALHTIVCVHLLLAYFDTRNRRSLVGCALSAGFAASTKMTGLAVVPLVLIWLIADSAVVRRTFEWKRGLMFGVVALLAASPWYIKSLVYTGNPVYPFFYSIFGGANWSGELAANYAALQAKFGVGHDLASFFLTPYDLTFRSAAFYDTPGLYVGPILLVAVPVLFLARWNPRKLVGLLGFFVSLMVIWFLLTQQSRYLIPAFAVLAVLIAAAVYDSERFRTTRTGLMLALVLTAAFGLRTLYPAVRGTAPVVFGTESRAQYLLRTLDIYPAQTFINDSLSDDVCIALFGDTRGYYLQRDYVWADPGHNTLFTRDFQSVAQFIEHLRSTGVTHALVNHRFFPQREGAAGTAKLVYGAIDEGYFNMVYSDSGFPASAAVYEIQDQ